MCIRNTWLNQNNSGKCAFFLDIDGLPDEPQLLTASFNTLQEPNSLELPDCDTILTCACTDKFCDAFKRYDMVVTQERIAAKQNVLPATNLDGNCACCTQEAQM